MGYGALNINTNIFALPQTNSDRACAYASSPYLFSIFNPQQANPYFQNQYNNVGLYCNNSYNYQTGNCLFPYFTNNTNLNFYTNLLSLAQINNNNSLNTNYFPEINFSIPEYPTDNIFKKSATNLKLFDPAKSEPKKNLSRDGLGAAVAAKASSFIGKVNNDAEGNRLFSNGKNQAWCQDFVSWNLGAVTNKLPKVMTTTSSPIAFRNKADELGCYNRVPASNRIQWAKNNIHKGDVIIKSGKGQSGLHVAIALDVKDDGTIIAVSGNSGNKVKRNTYNINKGDIYGVVDIEKLASAA